MKTQLLIVVAMVVGVFGLCRAQGGAPTCGDVNADLTVNVSDGAQIIGWQLLGGPAPSCNPPASCADVNGDTKMDISDGIYILHWLFRGGRAPQCPGVPTEIEGFTFTAINAHGYPEYTHDQTGIIFALLPGGKFNMGSPDDEPRRDPTEGPVHEVTLSPFLIGKYEVTQGQWKRVMGSVPPLPQGDSLPVERVSWLEVQEFEARTGLCLPTEAQWEYACRAGTQTAFSFGSGESCVDWEGAPCEERDPFMWYSGNSEGHAHEVGTKAPNPFGLHDMHGNVWEWCEDVYDSEFYSNREAVRRDPLCTSGPELRVDRGGCWGHSADGCRSAFRDMTGTGDTADGLGFRAAFWPLPSFVAMLPGGVPLELIWCPPGTFLMGAYPGEQDIDGDEVPQHRVTLTRGFYLGKYEVTKRQWQAVMGTTPWAGQPNVLDDPDSPAVYVSWDDAKAFVDLLGQGTFRLPTEAEREYACRAGTTTRFHWGDDPTYAQVGNYEWYLGNAGDAGEAYAHVVGLKLPNPWGLYDMNGNVEEWCQDWWSETYPSQAVTDPVGPPSGTLRALRCAGWFSDPNFCRSDDRGANWPSFRDPGQGFRVAR